MPKLLRIPKYINTGISIKLFSKNLKWLKAFYLFFQKIVFFINHFLANQIIN